MARGRERLCTDVEKSYTNVHKPFAVDCRKIFHKIPNMRGEDYDEGLWVGELMFAGAGAFVHKCV